MRTIERQLDKFYTHPDVAAKCLRVFEKVSGLTLNDASCIVEPSAGNGSFLNHLPSHTIGLDISPEHPAVKRQNFFTYKRKRPAIVLGNPPFGKNAHLAVRFFNHAAGFAEWIGFIVPRSFEKTSVQNRLDPNFHLRHSLPLDTQSFLFQNSPYCVPCVFQIWEKTTTPRSKVLTPLDHCDFVFTTPDKAHFAVQRIGVRAGTIKDEPHTRSITSHHFIKAHIEPKTLWKRFQTLPWDNVKHNTAGNPSISKRETVFLYAQSLLTCEKSHKELVISSQKTISTTLKPTPEEPNGKI